MKHIWQVFSYELSRNIRRKGYLFTTFGVPLIAVLLLAGYQAISNLTASQEDDAPPGQEFSFEGITAAGYVDHTGEFTQVSPPLDRLFTRYDDEAAAQVALEMGAIDVYYVIPADYMETGNVELVVPTLALNMISSAPAEQLILSALAADMDPLVYQRLLYPSNIQSVNLQRELPEGVGPQTFDARFLPIYIFALALIMGLFMTNGYLMQGVIEEKETRVIEILISSLRPVELLSGKILAFGILGIGQMAVWLSVFVVVLQFANVLPAVSVLASIYLPLDVLPVIGIYFLLAYMFFATAYGIVGALSTSMQEGPQYAVIFTLPAAIPFYFIGVFLETPDAGLPVFLSLFPLTSPLSMTMRLLSTTVPFEQIALSIGLLVLSIGGMMWLTGRLFRVQTLLAGQTPKLRDLPKLVRG
jgi:ABC-2 type transport system permease protein